MTFQHSVHSQEKVEDNVPSLIVGMLHELILTIYIQTNWLPYPYHAIASAIDSIISLTLHSTGSQSILKFLLEKVGNLKFGCKLKTNLTILF